MPLLPTGSAVLLCNCGFCQSDLVNKSNLENNCNAIARINDQHKAIAIGIMSVPFLRNFHRGGGQNREKRQNEKYELSRFG